MVGITFPRPVGPYADTKELEYISALLQTGVELRDDGTIVAQDIMYFLSSRHGIRVDEDVVRNAMILELAGSFAPPPLHRLKQLKEEERKLKEEMDGSSRTVFMDEPSGHSSDNQQQQQQEDEQEETKTSLMSSLLGGGSKKKKKKDGQEESTEEEEEEELKEPEAVMDLCQVLALLLIPFLRTGNTLLDDGTSTLLVGAGLSRRKRKLAEEDQDNEVLLGHVLDMALNNILGELRRDNHHGNSSKGIESKGVLIDIDRLRDILELFGEYDLPTTLLEEMIEVAAEYSDDDDLDEDMMETGRPFSKRKRRVFLNKATFLHALTADTQLYDPAHIDNRSKPSTHYDDARKAQEHQHVALHGKMGKSRRFGRMGARRGGRRRSSIFRRGSTVEVNHDHKLQFEEIYTAANIDNNADTYRSTAWFTLVWVEAVLLYFAYLAHSSWDVDDYEMMKNCTSEFGCAIAVSLINWIVIFLELMAMGLTWTFIATLGNANQPTEEWSQKLYTSLRLVLGMAMVGSVVFFTFFVEHEFYFWNTKKDSSNNQPAYYSAFVVGCFILLFQFLRLLGLYVNLGPLSNSGMEDKEQKIKSAATCKVRKMVEHAVVLHDRPPKLRNTSVSKTVLESASVFHHHASKVSSSSSRQRQQQRKNSMLNDIPGQASGGGSTIAKALLNFHRMEDTKEESGGILWAYQRLWDGSLLWKEGVYFHGRLIAVSLLQFFVIALMVALFFTYRGKVESFLAGPDDHCDVYAAVLNEDPIVDENWNDTIDGFVNVFNWNETHYTPDDGDTFVIGQLPRYNGSHFFTGTETVKTLCYSDKIAGYVPHGPPPPNQTESNSTDANVTDTSLLNSTVSGGQNTQQGNGPPGGEHGGPPGQQGGSAEQVVSNTISGALSFLTGDTTTTSNGPEQQGGPGDGNGGPPPGAGVVDAITETISTTFIMNPAEKGNEMIEALNIQTVEYQLSLLVGLMGAFAGCLGIALSYIPSFVSSVLKMRSGYLPSLKGDQITYFQYRLSPDQTATLFGLAFWGTFFTAAACFFLFGLVTFFLVWSRAREYVIKLISAGIGMSATIGMKVVVMIFLRGAFYSAYYRKRPAASNFMNVVLECWSLGLSIGTVATRMAQLLVVTAFYVGRIDTPMLAPGVGNIAGAPLDPAPISFKKDLLIHEAHRHPFIERLGLLFLIKLHNGKDFGTRAGAHWRMLFVLAICPWMRNYRVRPEHIDEDDYTDDDDFVNNVTSHTARRKRMSVFDNYDQLGPLTMHQGGRRSGGGQTEAEHQLEVELAREAYSRVNDQNRDLREALIAARDMLVRGNIPMDPAMEEHQLQVLQAPQPKSIYLNVTLWYDDIPGRLVLTKPGIAFYSDILENGVVVRIRWKNFAKHERNSNESPQTLLRLTTKGGICYEFHVMNRTIRARIRHDIALRLEEYRQSLKRDG